MCELCRKNFGESKRSDGIRRLAHRIIARIRPAKLVLFGSFARGDSNEASDADFLVVADFKEKFFDRIGKIIELHDGSFDLDTLAYTPQEFEKMVGQKNPFITRALKEGIVLA